MKDLKKALKTLTATQARMALILLRVNGKECAMEFIKEVSGKNEAKPTPEKLDKIIEFVRGH